MERTKNLDLTGGVVGSGGDGVIALGDIITSAVTGEGLSCFMVKTFGSQVRGGESSCKVRISEQPVLSQGDKLDILVVFNWSDYKKFSLELATKGDTVVVYDSSDPIPDDIRLLSSSAGPIFYEIPAKELAKTIEGGERSKNMVMLGALTEMFGLPDEAIRSVIRSKFSNKGPSVVKANISGFDAGRMYVRKAIPKRDAITVAYTKHEPKILISGNEAVALGAVAAGLEFFAGYPITPASEIMEYLARLMPLYDGVWIQAEDEIASIGMALGASFAGKRAMTSTSGPGLSLMNEIIGLSSLAEIPIVIVDVQRAGPSTGMPTKTEQADLQQALYGAHGDAPRVVIAPSDVEDCFYATMEAFCIAEEYQVPVIILSDQFLGHRKESLPRFDRSKITVCRRARPRQEDLKNFKRYLFTESGISPMSFPGIRNGQYTATGAEHDQRGMPSSDSRVHEDMSAKRFRKLATLSRRWKSGRRYGAPDAEVGVIGWGSSKGAIKEAVLQAESEGIKVAAFVPQLIHPLPHRDLDSFVKPLERIIVVEMSYSAQFLKYLRANFRLPADITVLKRSGGMPFGVDEIYSKIKREARTNVHY